MGLDTDSSSIGALYPGGGGATAAICGAGVVAGEMGENTGVVVADGVDTFMKGDFVGCDGDCVDH
jgi:hypothetical protein